MTRRVMIDPITNQILPEYLLPAYKAEAAGVRQVRVVGVYPNNPAAPVPPTHLIVEAPDERRFMLTITRMLHGKILTLADARGFDLSTYDAPDLRKIGLRPQKNRPHTMEVWDPFPLLPTEMDDTP